MLPDGRAGGERYRTLSAGHKSKTVPLGEYSLMARKSKPMAAPVKKTAVQMANATLRRLLESRSMSNGKRARDPRKVPTLREPESCSAPALPQYRATSLVRSGCQTVPHRKDPAPKLTCVGIKVTPTTTLMPASTSAAIVLRLAEVTEPECQGRRPPSRTTRSVAAFGAVMWFQGRRMTTAPAIRS